MEFGLDQLRTGLRPGSSYLDMSIQLDVRTCSNLVADRFAAGLNQIPLRYSGRRQVRSRSQTCRRSVADLLARASSLLAS